VSDRIAMLYEGRVLEEGTPDEIRNSKNSIVRGFVEGKPELVEKGVAELA
jgi:phospholipid/cholesterol/gamma-HCH transport system ATP-binding protein